MAGNVSLPTVVGPYHYYSLQGNLSEQLSSTDIHNIKSAKTIQEAALLNMRDLRYLIVVAVGGSDLRVLATTALVGSQEVQVQYAEASYRQTAAQAIAGTKAPIGANRSLVELQTEKQRLGSQRCDLIKQKMQLARILGVNTGRDLHLADKLSTERPTTAEPESVIHSAIAQRADRKAAGLKVKAAEEAYRASKAEYFPSFALSGNYGLQGIYPNKGASVNQTVHVGQPMVDLDTRRLICLRHRPTMTRHFHRSAPKRQTFPSRRRATRAMLHPQTLKW